MDAKVQLYIPHCFKTFQDFSVKDIKEYRSTEHMEVILESNEDRKHLCCRCGSELGPMKDRHWVRARHLRMGAWTVSVCFWREKRYCFQCKKVRSEFIDFICPTSPHMTLDLAWWINRLSEISTVLQVSKLESIDKMSCYAVDKHVLTRLLQGYQIPPVTHISVDEVYARSPVQQKKGESRDDLFLTVIVDQRTHKVIWVSHSRRKEALDTFFAMIGKEACEKIKIVTCDQHRGYADSVREHCPNAKLVWDKFHLVQQFNEALNEERKKEWDKYGDPALKENDLLAGKYRYIYLTKASNRNRTDQRHIEEVMKKNERIAKLEIIKEHFHKIFHCQDKLEAQVMLAECYEWAWQAKAFYLLKWIMSVHNREEFWNYFDHRLTSGVSEGINRAIKTLKWIAYGYKDMAYFALKIMQRYGYLNHKYALNWLYQNETTI